MAFTPAQQAATIQNLDTAIFALTNAKTTLTASPNTQFPVSSNIRRSMEFLLDALMTCGAALED